MDLRRPEIRTDSATMGAIIFVMGWYASPWQPRDTLFTQVLASQGLEDAWGITMMVVGILKFLTAVVIWIPDKAKQHWDKGVIFVSLAQFFVCAWTFLQFADKQLWTPTVLAMGVIAAGASATLVRDAWKKRNLRCRYGGLSRYG